MVRAIIHVVLRRRGLAPRYVPPISLILATHSRDYVAGLTASVLGSSAHVLGEHDQWPAQLQEFSQIHNNTSISMLLLSDNVR